jgi:glycosyltransferase involved in cell wall biosynthesis
LWEGRPKRSCGEDQIAAAGSIMRVSIIIPTFNRYDNLVRTLNLLNQQIRKQKWNDLVEILVIDDGSEDRVSRAIQSYLFKQKAGFIRYDLVKQNRGPSFARNTGVQQSRGDILIFLDDDIIPRDNYISETVRMHRLYPGILIINGNLRPLRDDVYSGFWLYHYSAVFNKPGETFYPVNMVSSGNVSIKRDLLDIENPLFDDSLKTREDYDLYLRLKKKSISVYKADNIVAFIECRDSLWGFLKQRLGYEAGETDLRKKHGAQLVAREERKIYEIPINRKYLHLYILLRIARWGSKSYGKFRRFFERHPCLFMAA